MIYFPGPTLECQFPISFVQMRKGQYLADNKNKSQRVAQRNRAGRAGTKLQFPRFQTSVSSITEHAFSVWATSFLEWYSENGEQRCIYGNEV